MKVTFLFCQTMFYFQIPMEIPANSTNLVVNDVSIFLGFRVYYSYKFGTKG